MVTTGKSATGMICPRLEAVRVRSALGPHLGARFRDPTSGSRFTPHGTNSRRTPADINQGPGAALSIFFVSLLNGSIVLLDSTVRGRTAKTGARAGAAVRGAGLFSGISNDNPAIVLAIMRVTIPWPRWRTRLAGYLLRGKRRDLHPLKPFTSLTQNREPCGNDSLTIWESSRKFANYCHRSSMPGGEKQNRTEYRDEQAEYARHRGSLALRFGRPARGVACTRTDVRVYNHVFYGQPIEPWFRVYLRRGP